MLSLINQGFLSKRYMNIGEGEMNAFVIQGEVLREEAMSKLECGGWV